jgi:hypothetical protein
MAPSQKLRQPFGSIHEINRAHDSILTVSPESAGRFEIVLFDAIAKCFS